MYIDRNWHLLFCFSCHALIFFVSLLTMNWQVKCPKMSIQNLYAEMMELIPTGLSGENPILVFNGCSGSKKNQKDEAFWESIKRDFSPFRRARGQDVTQPATPPDWEWNSAVLHFLLAHLNITVGDWIDTVKNLNEYILFCDQRE